MGMSETRADSSLLLNTPWPWLSTYEVLSESSLSIPKSAVDYGQHRFWSSGIIHARQLSARSCHEVPWTFRTFQAVTSSWLQKRSRYRNRSSQDYICGINCNSAGAIQL